jgi:hypothetical protein
MVVYQYSYAVFNKYIEEVYEARKKAKISGDETKNLIYKLLLNSLYGRLG